jgi:hypothetical protein
MLLCLRLKTRRSLNLDEGGLCVKKYEVKMTSYTDRLTEMINK